MVRILTLMLKLPLEIFAYSLEMLAKTVQGVQKRADLGIDALTGGVTQGNPSEAGGANQVSSTGRSEGADIETKTEAPAVGSDKTTDKENKTMTANDDKDLSGEDLKLVRYKILFTKRDYEHAFGETEALVADDMSDTDFTAWKIAEFVQDLTNKKIEHPKDWVKKNYPQDEYKEESDPNDPSQKRKSLTRTYRDKEWLTGIPEKDKKYLRLYYQVLDRYPREPFKYEEDQIDVLK